MIEGSIDLESGKLRKVYYETPSIAIWKSTTRLILREHPIQELLYYLDEALYEASNDQWLEEKYPKGFFKEDFQFPKRKTVKKFNLRNARVKKVIDENLKITDIARDYGIIIKKGKAICPFHIDTDPSLSFSDSKNVFNCFGCHVKGDLITFIKLMEEKRDGNKRES